MLVNMPVECVGDFCKNCPDLDIMINRLYYGCDHTTTLVCAHAESCERIKDRIYKEMEERRNALGNGANQKLETLLE